MVQRCKRWTDRLLDLSLNNRLLNFRPGARSSFRLLVPDLAMFEDALADARADLADLHARRRADLDRRVLHAETSAESTRRSIELGPLRGDVLTRAHDGNARPVHGADDERFRVAALRMGLLVADAEEVLAAFDPLASANPSSSFVPSYRAEVLHWLGRHAEADCEAAIALDPSVRSAYLGLAQARMWRGDLAGAHAIVAKLGWRLPQLPTLPAILGELALLGCRAQEARTHLESAVRAHPTRLSSWLLLLSAPPSCIRIPPRMFAVTTSASAISDPPVTSMPRSPPVTVSPESVKDPTPAATAAASAPEPSNVTNSAHRPISSVGFGHRFGRPAEMTTEAVFVCGGGGPSPTSAATRGLPHLAA